MDQGGGIRVGDLVEIEQLGLTTEAGAGGLFRMVSWAHVCELEEPGPWLDGGELIMTTGLALPRPAAAQAAYLERLDAAGAAGLAVAAGMSAPPLTARARRRADELGFPILRVSYEVPFIAISRVVVAANDRTLERRVLRALTIFDALRRGTGVLDSPEEVLARLESLSGYDLAVLAPDGSVLLGDAGAGAAGGAHGAAGGPGAADGGAGVAAEGTRVATGGSAGASPRRGVTELDGVRGRRRYVLPLGGSASAAGSLVAVERRPGSGLGTLALQHVATVAGVQLAALRRDREVHFRVGREVLTDLLSGTVPASTLHRRLRLVRLDPDAEVVLAAVGAGGRQAPDEQDREVHDRCADRGTPVLTAREGDVLWVAHPADRTPPWAVVATGAVVGASRPFTASGGALVAAREARWALAEAARSGRPVVVVGEPEADPVGWLPEDERQLSLLAERTLGPLLEPGRADLLTTLETYLRSGQRIDPTCRAIGVHRHTLAHRLRRAEELTGRRLDVMDDLVELWRAISALRVLAPATPAQAGGGQPPTAGAGPGVGGTVAGGRIRAAANSARIASQ